MKFKNVKVGQRVAVVETTVVAGEVLAVDQNTGALKLSQGAEGWNYAWVYVNPPYDGAHIQIKKVK